MNWRTELETAMTFRGDTLIQLVVQDPREPASPQVVSTDHPIFDRDFDGGYGGSEGCYFTAWGESYVYFPAVYDGAEWIASAPRNPCSVAMSHVGGE